MNKPSFFKHSLQTLLVCVFALVLIPAICFSHTISEDFNSNTLIHQWGAYGGSWQLNNGSCILPSGPGYKAVSREGFKDLSYSARVRVINGIGFGLIFRVTEASLGADSFKGYYAYIEPTNNFIGIGKMNHNWTFITGISTPLENNIWYDLSVEAVGDKIDVYLNGDLKLSIVDSEHVHGSVGVRSWLGTSEIDSLVATPPVDGIYHVTGHDYIGEYTGTIEVRLTDIGRQIIRLIDYTNYTFKNYSVSSASTGGAMLYPDRSLHLMINYNTVGFIKSAESMERDSNFQNNHPAVFNGVMMPSGPEKYSGSFSGNHRGIEYRHTENWVRVADNGPHQIWQNLRHDLKTVDDSSSSMIDLALVVSEYNENDYNSMPEVQAYVDRQEFKDKIHFWVFDPTDFDYYQANENKNRLRVIQKIIDPISLYETLLRNHAYSYKLHEKEAYFNNEVQAIMINELGMVSRWNASENRYSHDGDSLLWTGVYVAAMAKKYMVTSSSDALSKMLKSLNAVINCIEIVKNSPNDSLSSTFARSIMLDRGRSDRDPEWRRGTMSYSPHTTVEYKRGGNNDMTKGIFIGMLWANKALKQVSSETYSTIISQYGDIKVRMVQALANLRAEHDDLFLNKCKAIRADQAPKWPNTMQMNLVLYNLVRSSSSNLIIDWNDDIKSCYTCLKPYWGETDVNFMNYGGSISDWSGNHLTIWGLYNNYQGFIDAAGYNSGEANKFRGYLQNADEHMITHRLGLFKLISGTQRQLPSHPYWVDQAIWRLREMTIPREPVNIDWTINPDFTISPYPELLWKFKQSEAKDRLQSLRAYPLFQSTSSSYYWKDNPFNKFRGSDLPGRSGIDFLIAYWFGRYNNLISPDM